jgi:hypothetical protein
MVMALVAEQAIDIEIGSKPETNRWDASDDNEHQNSNSMQGVLFPVPKQFNCASTPD